MYVPRARYSLRMSFCTVPDSFARSMPWRSAMRDVHGQQDDGRGVDRHRRRHPLERDAVEQLRHVVERIDRDADPPDLACGQRMVRVVAHLRRQIERDAQTGHPLRQQMPISAIRLCRGAEPGVLPHRPEPAAVHRWLDARVKGNSPGWPRSRSGSQPARSAGTREESTI